jgi:hypothetical protein
MALIVKIAGGAKCCARLRRVAPVRAPAQIDDISNRD